MTDAALAAVRQRYAASLTDRLPAPDPRLRAAFAAVPREAFAGPPPWSLLGVGHRPLPVSDPADLYADLLIVLDAEQGLNNGSPSLHADMLHRLDVQPGDHVLHVGAGGGYYTALLAELTGPAGCVEAVEFDPPLARAAADNLRRWPWVRLHHGDGANHPTRTVQRIYVNFALAAPPARWLDHLAVGGRLLLPLGVADPAARGDARHHSSRAAVLTVTREPSRFAATLDIPVAFVCARGPAAGDAETRMALWQAFGRGGADTVAELVRVPADPARAWVSTPAYSLLRRAG